MREYEFPQDPRLPTAASLFDGRPVVLRYIPRRRLTFRTVVPDRTDAAVIGKLVRRADALPAYDRLLEVSRAADCRRPSFSVAAPVWMDETNGVFFQEAKRGREVSAWLDADGFRETLRTVGAVHRDLHRLDVANVPEWDLGAFLERLREHVDWIAFFWPEQRALLEDVRDLLLARVPRVDQGAYTFCHGDFRCSQVLKGDDGWSVIDFDDCVRGDPYLDMARLMAFLKNDVPFFMNWWVGGRDPGLADLLEEACEAYLDGYQERRQEALDRARLLWYRVACEIHCLARAIQRDLICPASFERTIGWIQELGRRLP
jgi:aminoglycoside phosphotransferase (APT) family kinase protein